jgi:hypothetical protein
MRSAPVDAESAGMAGKPAPAPQTNRPLHCDRMWDATWLGL